VVRTALACCLAFGAAVAGSAEPAKPGAGSGTVIPTAPPSPASPKPTCANQLYFCPSGASCTALNAVPGGLAALGAQPFDAYRCHFPAQLGVSPNRSPTSCPPGLVLTPLPAPPGTIAVAQSVCAPAENACLPAPAGWQRVTPVMPFAPPPLGYTCRYSKAG
jgi:hypothetical protein